MPHNNIKEGEIYTAEGKIFIVTNKCKPFGYLILKWPTDPKRVGETGPTEGPYSPDWKLVGVEIKQRIKELREA